MFVQSAVLLTLTRDRHCTPPCMEYDTAQRGMGGGNEAACKSRMDGKTGERGRQPGYWYIYRHGVKIRNLTTLARFCVRFSWAPPCKKNSVHVGHLSLWTEQVRYLRESASIQSWLVSSHLSVMFLCKSESIHVCAPNYLLHLYTLDCMSGSCAHLSDAFF